MRPLDAYSEVVDPNRRWTPPWYSWLEDLSDRSSGWGSAGAISINSASSLTSAMNGSTVLLGGNAYYDFTIPDPTTFNPSFVCLLVNNDNYPGGRAKRIVPAVPGASDFPTFNLWPKQSLFLFNTVNQWHTSPDVNKGGLRWKLDGVLTFFINQNLGTSNGDGLATGAGAFDTLQNAFITLCQAIDANGQQVVFQLDGDAGTPRTYSTGLAFNQSWTGGGGLTIKGNPSSPDSTFINVSAGGASAGYPFLFTGYPGGFVSVQSLKLASSVANAIGVSIQSTASVQVTDVTLGDCPLSHFHSGVGGAALFIVGNVRVSGNSNNWCISNASALVSMGSGVTITLTRAGGTQPPKFTGAFLNGGASAALNASLPTYVNDAGKSRVTATSGDITNTSTDITNLTFPSGDTSQLSTGMSVTGPGIPYNGPPTNATVITSILSANSVRLSAAATATTVGATNIKFEIAHGPKFFVQTGAVVLGPTGKGVDGPPGDTAGTVVAPGSFVG